ncbi:MAG: hypothetical protein Q8O12_01095 [Candidatus Omnitrophota bacterium]|nr:hypothetical protein [Candidatus Omnitrophota bacterium]
MESFKKDIVKGFSLALSIVFLTGNVSYGYYASNDSSLRAPVGQRAVLEEMEEVAASESDSIFDIMRMEEVDGTRCGVAVIPELVKEGKAEIVIWVNRKSNDSGGYLAAFKIIKGEPTLNYPSLYGSKKLEPKPGTSVFAGSINDASFIYNTEKGLLIVKSEEGFADDETLEAYVKTESRVKGQRNEPEYDARGKADKNLASNADSPKMSDSEFSRWAIKKFAELQNRTTGVLANMDVSPALEALQNNVFYRLAHLTDPGEERPQALLRGLYLAIGKEIDKDRGLAGKAGDEKAMVRDLINELEKDMNNITGQFTVRIKDFLRSIYAGNWSRKKIATLRDLTAALKRLIRECKEERRSFKLKLEGMEREISELKKNVTYNIKKIVKSKTTPEKKRLKEENDYFKKLKLEEINTKKRYRKFVNTTIKIEEVLLRYISIVQNELQDRTAWQGLEQDQLPVRGAEEAMPDPAVNMGL